ncbi:MAG: FliM/FliN family flagellar motor switch protein [Mucispirillum sp.]|nr:FliM/FliN family flagellar motor switch protein [Mucispirillum sp.]
MMTETVNFLNSPSLEKFSELVVSTFASSLSAISSRTVNLSLGEMVKCDADTLFAAYENETLVVSKEDNGGYETGLLFRTRDITKLADFMLAGDGESKDEIDDDTKDAVQELTSQLLSSLNVPFEEAFSNKFSFKSEDVIKNTSSSLFQCSEYYCIDLTGDVDGAELNFRFVCDTNIEAKLGGQDDSSLVDDGSIEALLGNAGISFDDEPAESSGNTPKNLDLLLDIDIPISVRMGSAKLFLKDILGLGPGNIVELEQNADDPIELAINDKVIARGEVVIVDGYFGFRIKEIISKAERIRKLKD